MKESTKTEFEGDERNKSKKPYSNKKKRIALVVLISLLITGLILGLIYLIWYTSPQQVEKRQLEELQRQTRAMERIVEQQNGYSYSGDYYQDTYNAYKSTLDGLMRGY